MLLRRVRSRSPNDWRNNMSDQAPTPPTTATAPAALTAAEAEKRFTPPLPGPIQRQLAEAEALRQSLNAPPVAPTVTPPAPTNPTPPASTALPPLTPVVAPPAAP